LLWCICDPFAEVVCKGCVRGEAKSGAWMNTYICCALAVKHRHS
jgi:hypothetical protein